MMHEIEVADAQVEQFDLSRLPPDWNSVPHSSTSQAIGDAWLEQRRSAALRVPSLHSRTEFNVLLNPGHGRADLFATLRTWTHHFDPRMFP
jgi:RES domain-containing protein